MKKLVVLFAMVFAVSMVMAQKTTILYQSGNYNSADVTQNACLSVDDNYIFAGQTGNWNTLTTSQKGWNNEIELHQSGDDNTATMEQLTCDFGTFNGFNTATVYQQGDRNTATLSQMEEDGDAADGWFFGIPILPEHDRSMNFASATQSGTSNNYSLEQGRQVHQPDNESYLVQSGDYNDAAIQQLGIVNYSEIRQTGDWNDAGLLQTGDDLLLTSTYDHSYSWQTGDNNGLVVKQVGEVDEQLAESTQNGNNNSTTITQVGYTEQDVNAWQLGTSDAIVVSQIDEE